MILNDWIGLVWIVGTIFLFVLLAFAGVLDSKILINMIAVQILFKFIVSFFELGFLYGLRSLKARGLLLHRGKEPAPAFRPT
jgi:uncharacterized PurR-regulated membrane protein YhhQ (DUF165 family)